MELRHLRYFVAVAQELSFRKAAERLHVTQPPLSLQIKQLEDEIGTKLFSRNNHKVSLTEAGTVFLEKAEQILHDAGLAKNAALQAAEGKTGRLRILFAPSASAGFLEHGVRAYRTLYPHVHLELQQSTSAEIPLLVAEGQADIGIVRLPIEVPQSLKMHIVRKEGFVVAMPKNHPFAKKASLGIEDLGNTDLVMTPKKASPYYHMCIMSLFAEKKVVPRIAQEAIEQLTIAGLVAGGLGLAIIPDMMKNISYPGITHVPLRGTVNRTGLGALTQTDGNVLVKNYLKTIK